MGGPEMAPQTPQTLGAPRRSRGAPRPPVFDRRADRRGGPEAGRPAITPRVAWHRGASLARADPRGRPGGGRPRSLLAWRGTEARRLPGQIGGAGPEAGRPAITPRVAWHRGA